MTERAPVPCPEMQEIRAQIDALDKRLVALLAERQKLIAAAGEVKPSRDTVRDEARIEEVVQLVLAEAEKSGLARPSVCRAHQFAHESLAFQRREWEHAGSLVIAPFCVFHALAHIIIACNEGKTSCQP